MRFGILFGLLAVCGLAAAAASPSTNAQKWSFRTGPAPRVNVSTISGTITAVAADGDAVAIEGAASDSRWTFDVKQEGDTIKAAPAVVPATRSAITTATGARTSRCAFPRRRS